MSSAAPHQQTDRAPAAVAVGREAERARLVAELDRVRDGQPGAALLTGAAGSGKTALVAELARGAPDVTTVWLSGEAFEQELRLGVVDQLFRAVGAPLEDVLLATGDAALPLEPSLRVLEALGELQAPAPVLLVVDDTQWVDVASLHALLFALRRLMGERVLAVFTCRDACGAHAPEGVRRLVERRDGPVLHLGPLAPADLQKLARGLGIELGEQWAARLAEHTGGNPLLARAVLMETSPERWPPRPAPLPVPRSYVEIVRMRLDACPPDARALAFAAAVLGRSGRLADAARLAGVAEAAVAFEPLAAAELMRRVPAASGGDLVAFAHPLAGAAVHERVPAPQRAALHLAAARAAGDAELALRHRVQAADGHDAELADAMTALADREAARGAWARAAQTLAEAGRLSPEPEAATGRLLQGIDLLLLSGDLTGARALAEELTPGEGVLRDAVLGHLLVYEQRPAEAHTRLVRAWAACDPDRDPATAARVSRSMVHMQVADLRMDEVLLWSDRALERTAPGDPTHTFALGSRALALGYRGQAAAAAVEIEPAIAAAPEAEGIGLRLSYGWLALARDDLGRARHELHEVARTAVRAGSFNFACLAYAHLARAEYLAGAWDEAAVHVERAAAIAAEYKGLGARSYVPWIRAMLAVARGDRLTLDALEAELDTAAPVLAGHRAAAAIARGLVHAARGDHAAVVGALEPVAGPDAPAAVDEPGFWPWPSVQAAALLALGRLEELEGFVARHEAIADRRGLRSAQGRMRRVRAQLAMARGQAEEAIAALEEAVALHTAVGMPFERAVDELALGEVLRRQGRRRAAADVLGRAHATLSRLGAAPAVERVERELVACGLTPARRGADRDLLTPQEREVRRLVARGMTNRQVAADLLVSTKTVEVHLTRIYSKLGVRSRAQLIAAAADEG